MRVVCVAGARPNFMKIKRVVDALEARGVEVVVVHTGQHYDPAMCGGFFDECGLRPPDLSLDVGSASHAQQTAAVMVAFEPVLDRLRPDVVVVVGDVNSTLAAALVTAKSPALLAHVEAGLRSRDWTMPEEVNRVVTDRVSDLLFAPSPDGVDSLAAEGVEADRIHLVGNVMIDTLLANLERSRDRPVAARLGVDGDGYGVVTLHRPANVDDPATLEGILGALAAVSAACPLVLPVHPRSAPAIRAFGLPPSVVVAEPLGYLDFLALQAGARIVLTYSGGVQEETTALGIPRLTQRDNTERPITMTDGTNRVVDRDPERMVAEAQAVLRAGVEARQPALWDGRAAQRIADALVGARRTEEWPVARLHGATDQDRAPTSQT
ncbi:MAG: non-hydrolyzing UDP-N-acetylglucosamine 2-epimerase [Pseudonocardiaceae bacterium]